MLVKLGDAFTIGSGGTPSKQHPEYYGGSIPWVKTGDLGEQYIYSVDECITEEGLKNSSARLYAPDTVLVAMYGATIGATSILKISACTNQACAAFLTNNEVIPEYLYYFLLSKKQRFVQDGVGGAQPNISATYLKGVLFPLRTYEEQSAIVDKLSRVTEVIKQRKHQLHVLDELIKARFVELFGDPEINPMGWRVEKLGALLSVEPQNGLYKPQSDYVQDGTGTPILRIDAFYEGKVTSFSGLKRLACTDTERMRYLLHENDIVINRVNSIEYLGKCAWITGMIEPTVFESNMMRFHVDESQVDPCYLTRLLCSTYMYNQILNRAKKAVNQASINQGDVQSFLIVVPPIGLQKSFATFVSQVDKSKLSIQSNLDQLEILKQSLMKKYFG